MGTVTDDDVQTLFARLRDKAKRVVVNGQTYWRVEGDLLLDEAELRRYAAGQVRLRQARAAGRIGDQPLVAIATEEDGRMIRWAPGKDLVYCVLRRTFAVGGGDGHQLVVESMRQATSDWEQTCGVRFVHRRSADDSDATRPDGVVFTVQEQDTQGTVIASAFFPNDPPEKREVWIDPSFYEQANGGYDPIGVLRHELGHVLGFRHEHIRSDAPPGCPDEQTYGTIDLSKYDPRSVMHYFCGGVGSHKLEISQLDREGAQKAYGPPFSSYSFVD